MENNQEQKPIETGVPSTPLNIPPVIEPQKMSDTAKSGVGPIIATIIIIAVIILGGLYFWGKRIETQKMQQTLMQTSVTTDDTETTAINEGTRIENISQDDSINAIESETQTTNTTNLSAGL